jgi:uncharacterized protein (DUF2345 family)
MEFRKQARFFFLAFVTFFITTFVTALYLFAYPTGAPAGRTGGLSSSTCTSCHSLTTNNAALSLSGIPTTYTPGQAYTIGVTLSVSASGSGFGFQISSRSTPGGAQAGTLAGSSSGTGVNGTSGGVTYVGQTSRGCSGATSCSWNVSWTAPAATAGPVQFDVASVSAYSGGTFAQKSVTASVPASQPAPAFAASNPVSPNTGSTSGGTSVTINGSSFVSGAVVSFGATAATTTFVSATQLTATTPAAAAGAVSVKVQNPDTQSATLPNGFTYIAPAPAFAASNPVSPTSGPTAGGTTVTINGSNFVSGAVVSFGTTAASTTFVSATQLRAVTPAAAAGAVSVKVQNPDTQSATLPNGFTYIAPAPAFAASNPVSPTSGPTAGGTTVTINGSNFVSGAVVSFGTSAASTTFVSSTQLRAVTPAAAGGAVSVKVQNPDAQSATLTNGFAYIAPAPAFAGTNPVSPTSGTTAGGTTVTINGSNFVSGATVSFGSTAASTTFVSSAQLRAVTPAAAAGAVSVKVQNPDGQSATLPNGYTYTAPVLPPPAFAASNPVSPVTGPTAGGTTVTINGSNFVSGAAVIFGSTAASTTFVNATRLTAVTPSAAAGAVAVKVQNPDGQSATLMNGFTYIAPAPAFAGTNPVSPTSGSTAGGATVTINGSNFVSGATVSFGSTAATTAFVSSTQLTANTPSAAAGAVSVKVQNPDGQSATLPNGYTYTTPVLPPPAFAASNPVSPVTGTTAGGTTVTINGSNFVSGAAVSFGSAAASTTFVNATRLTAVTPAAAAGAVTVKVQNPDGQSATLPSGFTYAAPAPAFTGTNPVSPNTGSTAGGTTVTINGSNFVSGATVSFGTTAASTTFVNATQLTATTPAASAGAVSVKVQNPDGQFATLPNGFTYTAPPPPQFAGSNPVSPNTGSTAGGTTVTINGSNFVNGAVVSFGSTAASTSFVSSTQLTVVTPLASAGAVSVKVQNPDGQSATLPNGFTYTQVVPTTPAPQFSASSPSAPHIGPMGGGTTVSINGANFVNGATVYFGSVPSKDTRFISSTQLKASSPGTRNSGAVDLRVQNPDRQSATLPGAFTYYDDEDDLEIGYAICEEDQGSGSYDKAGSRVRAVSPGSLSGGGIFSFSQNKTLVTTVGTIAAPPTTSFLMFVDSKPLNSLKGALPNNTGVAIINPASVPADLTLTLLKADGTSAGPSVSTRLATGAHFQGFVTDSNFFGAAADNFTGTMRVDSTLPISAISLQQINNQAPRQESLLTSTPVADLAKPAPRGNLVFPQFVDGGGYQTRIMLVNTSDIPISGKVLFARDEASSPDNSDLRFDTSNEGGPEIRYQIQPLGQFSALSSGTGGFHLGFAMVVPDPGSLTPSGTALLYFTPGDMTVTTAGVAASPATNFGLVLVDSTPTTKNLAQNTGVAFANPSATMAIDVIFKLRDLMGNVMETQSYSQLKGSLLRPQGHSSFFVNELFGSVASNFTGTMSIETSAPEGVSAVTLLLTTNERNETLFTTLPVAIPASASSTVFFPQLVSGRGYETRMVVLNLSTAADSVNLNFYSGSDSNNGSPMALPLNDTVSSVFKYTVPPVGVVILK